MSPSPATPPTLESLWRCFDGVVPAMMATSTADGTPNVAYLSQVYYVDERHVALSFQFFNKTRRNVLANPLTELLVIHPRHGAMYRIGARYLRTETEGAVFERMRAKLAGIASHTGMSGVFRLRGADLYAAGLSSFASVQIMLAIEETFDLEFPDNLLNRKSFQSIAAITRTVEGLIGNAEAAE